MENYISPKEINCIEDHKKIIKYMSEISVVLEKPVILTPEKCTGNDTNTSCKRQNRIFT